MKGWCFSNENIMEQARKCVSETVMHRAAVGLWAPSTPKGILELCSKESWTSEQSFSSIWWETNWTIKVPSLTLTSILHVLRNQWLNIACPYFDSVSFSFCFIFLLFCIFKLFLDEQHEITLYAQSRRLSMHDLWQCLYINYWSATLMPA